MVYRPYLKFSKTSRRISMIEFTDGKWECDECGDWWADKNDAPVVCPCENDDEEDYDEDYGDECDCDDARTSWCDTCRCYTTQCHKNPYGTCQCS
jgi:hypothetical protein